MVKRNASALSDSFISLYRSSIATLAGPVVYLLLPKVVGEVFLFDGGDDVMVFDGRVPDERDSTCLVSKTEEVEEVDYSHVLEGGNFPFVDRSVVVARLMMPKPSLIFLARRRKVTIMASIEELWIYPIKSCQGVQVQQSKVTSTG